MDRQDWDILRKTPLFGSISQGAVEQIVGGHAARAYERGTVLFRQGETADCFYVVLEGWVKIYRTSVAGEETVVNVFNHGETFAEAATFMGGRYPVAAECVTLCRLQRIDSARFRRCIHGDPDLALAMLASASQHLKALVVQIEQMKRMNVDQRLADFLIGLCPAREGRFTVPLPFEKLLIANRLGIAPESLSRALARLRAVGVTVDRSDIRIEDVGRLVRFVEITREDD
jgi:CRP-like cAMP-binding protein